MVRPRLKGSMASEAHSLTLEFLAMYQVDGYIAGYEQIGDHQVRMELKTGRGVIWIYIVFSDDADAFEQCTPQLLVVTSNHRVRGRYVIQEYVESDLPSWFIPWGMNYESLAALTDNERLCRLALTDK